MTPAVKMAREALKNAVEAMEEAEKLGVNMKWLLEQNRAALSALEAEGEAETCKQSKPSATDKERLDSILIMGQENVRTRWWHWVPFVGLAACAIEDAIFAARIAAIRAEKKEGKR